MATKRVRAINFTPTIQALLKEYGNEVYEVLNACVDEVAAEAEGKLHGATRFAPGGNPSGEYAKSWVTEKIPAGLLGVERDVHNKEHYRLTHLLENGHVSRNGTKRTFGFVKAYPHIRPVNDWAKTEIVNRVKEGIKRI